MKYGLIATAGMLLMWAMTAGGWADEVSLEPSIAIREEYNDNIFFEFETGQDDYITTVVLGLDFLNRVERRDLKLGAKLAPFYYRDNSEIDETDVDVSADLGYLLTPRLKTHLDGFYRIDNRPDRDIDATGQVFGSDQRDRYHAGATADLALHENHSVYLSYSYDQDDWREDVADRQDFEGHTANLGYNYNMSRWSEATELLLNFGFGRYDYETSEIDSAYAAVGIDHMLSQIFRLKASVGARFNDSEFEILQDVEVMPGTIVRRIETVKNEAWGGIGSLGLEYLGERTRYNLSLYHDLRTAGSTQGAANLTRLTFNSGYRILEKLSLGFFTGSYFNKADAGEFSTEEEEKLTFISRPSIRWEFWDHFALEGAYQYDHVDDKIDDSLAERSMVYLQLRFGYDLLD